MFRKKDLLCLAKLFELVGSIDESEDFSMCLKDAQIGEAEESSDPGLPWYVILYIFFFVPLLPQFRDVFLAPTTAQCQQRASQPSISEKTIMIDHLSGVSAFIHGRLFVCDKYAWTATKTLSGFSRPSMPRPGAWNVSWFHEIAPAFFTHSTAIVLPIRGSLLNMAATDALDGNSQAVPITIHRSGRDFRCHHAA